MAADYRCVLGVTIRYGGQGGIEEGEGFDAIDLTGLDQ